MSVSKHFNLKHGFFILLTFSFTAVLVLYAITEPSPVVNLYSDFKYNLTRDGGLHLPLPNECIFPEVDPFDPYILKLSSLHRGTLACDVFWLDLTYIDGLSIRVDVSKSFSPSYLTLCMYRNVTRVPNQDNQFTLSQWSEPFAVSISITDEHEFLLVQCHRSDSGDVISKSFYSLVPRHAHLRAMYDALIEKRQFEFNPKETLNIIAVALDGLPRHQMLRSMPKTYKFLTEQLKSFDFTKHGQTGDHTFPNMLSLLSANSYEDVRQWWRNGVPQDAFNLIWNDFERAGYRTLFTEDKPSGGGFYWTGNTFLHPQTSYWNRPLELAMEQEEHFLWRERSCVGTRPITEYHLDYLVRFLDTFTDAPVAGMAVISEITHSDTTRASLVDEHILNFYNTLAAKGHLERSVIMFFSDHGSRWGEIRKTYNGVIDSRNPFLILTFPPWFLEKYPDLVRTLQTNTHRLTSHFDTRLTLLDLLYFKSQIPTPPYRGKHGLSLFHEIPRNRTCADASIPAEQCLCGVKVENYISTASPVVPTLTQALLSAIKQKSDPVQCEEYFLGRVLQVGILALPAPNRTMAQSTSVYIVRLAVEPGGAIFEATVTMEPETNETNIGNSITRLNMYRGEVECLPSPKQQMYCYCKRNRRFKNRQGVIQ